MGFMSAVVYNQYFICPGFSEWCILVLYCNLQFAWGVYCRISWGVIFTCSLIELRWLWMATFCLLYGFFWVIPRRLNAICRRLGTLCLFHLHRQVGMKYTSYLPAYGDGTECSETSAYKIQAPGNYPEESTQHSEHGESLKSRIYSVSSSPVL